MTASLCFEQSYSGIDGDSASSTEFYVLLSALSGVPLRQDLAVTGSVDQHPVLMDCARSQRKYARVESLWDELSAASPSAALVIEGRIVLAGSLADLGRLRDAIALLERRLAKRPNPGQFWERSRAS